KEATPDTALAGKKFFQYAYTTGEFKKMLAEAGLRTIKTKGYAILWGLRELPGFNLGGSERISPGKPVSGNGAEAVDLSELIRDQHSSLIKRLAVSEDDKIPVLGFGVQIM